MPPSSTSSTARGLVVTDLEGRRYTLSRLIGQGAQGEVYEVKEGRLAVKLLRSVSDSERERLRRCIQAVKRLDLEGLPIACPIAVLRPPNVGYLMQLADRMSSLRSIMNPPADGRSVPEWYVKTGGLRARLRRLAAVFDVFARFHSRGLVYGDPSPQNILFSPGGKTHFIFLIDPDNLHVQGSLATAGVFTPGYGAPELVTGSAGPDTLTDAFALAVIAFELIALVHPFVGDLVHDGEPELEEAAYQCRMPWIEHSSDTSNRCSRGIPRELVISPEATKLFKRMFEVGLNQRLLRPSLREFAEVFTQAADVTILCPRCNASYYAPSTQKCPWCGQARPELSLAVFQLWDPERTSASGVAPGAFVTSATGARRSLATMVLAAKEAVQIFRRHIQSDSPTDQDEQPLLEAIRTSDQAIRVRNLTKEPMSLIKHAPKATTELLEGGREKLIPISPKAPHWYLHFGSMEKLHRAVVFKPMP